MVVGIISNKVPCVCDNCGSTNVIGGKNKITQHIWRVDFSNIHKVDLCSNCLAELQDLIEESLSGGRE